MGPESEKDPLGLVKASGVKNWANFIWAEFILSLGALLGTLNSLFALLVFVGLHDHREYDTRPDGCLIGAPETLFPFRVPLPYPLILLSNVWMAGLKVFYF